MMHSSREVAQNATTDGAVAAIWIKPARRGLMDAAASAELVTDRGLLGSANQGGRRQVTIIEEESWHAMMAELGAALPPSVRRANIMVRGVRLKRSRGSTLRIGDCVLEVMGETRPCERMDEALPGLKHAMSPDWRGGVFARVVRGGSVTVGDRVVLQHPNTDLFSAHDARKDGR